jgi:hypothetical protein
MSDRPTDNAKERFGRASSKASEASRLFSYLKMGADNKLVQQTDKERAQVLLADSVHYLAWGMRDLSAGLRATYMLLEEINRKLPK